MIYWMKVQGVVENKLAFNKSLLDHDVWTWSTRVLRRGSVSVYGIRLCFVMFHVEQILDDNKRQSVGVWSIVNHVYVVWVVVIMEVCSWWQIWKIGCGGWWKVFGDGGRGDFRRLQFWMGAFFKLWKKLSVFCVSMNT